MSLNLCFEIKYIYVALKSKMGQSRSKEISLFSELYISDIGVKIAPQWDEFGAQYWIKQAYVWVYVF